MPTSGLTTTNQTPRDRNLDGSQVSSSESEKSKSMLDLSSLQQGDTTADEHYLSRTKMSSYRKNEDDEDGRMDFQESLSNSEVKPVECTKNKAQHGEHLGSREPLDKLERGKNRKAKKKVHWADTAHSAPPTPS